MPVGRPLNIKTEKQFKDLFEAYRKETKDNPIKKHVFVGKDGVSEYEKRERPLTLEGFKNYCRRNGVGEIEQYFVNQDSLYPQYIRICRIIKEEIRQDQIEGGMAMIYNPSITQRLNGLVEKQSVEVKSEQPLFPDKKD